MMAQQILLMIQTATIICFKFILWEFKEVKKFCIKSCGLYNWQCSDIAVFHSVDCMFFTKTS